MVSPESRKNKEAYFEGSRIAYDSYGSGPTALVFIHGWTCARSLWTHQSALYEQYRSILVDLPGHGQSDAPDIDYTHEFFANAVAAVLDQEQVSQALFVAHSMGGPVANMFLRLFPKRVLGIIYLDSFFHLPENYKSHAERRALGEARRDDTTFRDMIPTFFTEKTGAEDREKIIDTMMATPVHVRLSATTTTSVPHALAWDQIFQIPALHIAAPYNAEKADGHWFHHIPQLQTNVWHDHGHFLFVEDPERLNAEVEAFLREKNLLQK